jgi:predicted transposase YbfD/YdcC
MKEFEVVKYFKSIYTQISTYGEEISFSNNKFFYENDPHFLMYGELVYNEDNDFIKWSSDKSFYLKFSDVDNLRDCLKKNVISMSSGENFEIKYKDKNTEIEKIFVCSKSVNSKDLDNKIEKIKEIENKLIYSSKFDYSKLEASEIVELYILDDGSVTTERTREKLIEIPFKRVLAILKNSEIIVDFSEKGSDGKRYVKISSSNEFIKLNQIYATI